MTTRTLSDSQAAPFVDRPTGPRNVEIVSTRTGRRTLAVLRLATGFIFLWAFRDKTFGLGFSTPAERAWVAGGTPS